MSTTLLSLEMYVMVAVCVVVVMRYLDDLVAECDIVTRAVLDTLSIGRTSKTFMPKCGENRTLK